MNIVDYIIIIFILMFGIVGSKRGFFKQLALTAGTILVFYIAYNAKDMVGDFLMLRLPMLDFPNLFKGVVTLNIVVYQLIAFLLVLAVLLVVLNIVVIITGVFERFLKFTILLGIPSKILGFILGLVEGYVIAFVILFFINQPAFSFDVVLESNLTNRILTSSPVLTNITSDTVELVEDIYELKNEEDTTVLNRKIFDMILDKKIINYRTALTLYKNKKIYFDGIEVILKKYKD